jgi:integrase/recombinase XerD
MSAVGGLYVFHARHGVDCANLLTVLRPAEARGPWRPFLAHLGSEKQRGKAIKLAARRALPKTFTSAEIDAITACCSRLRDKFLIRLLAETGMRIGEMLGLRHDDIDPAGRLVRVRPRLNHNGARAKSGAREIPVGPALIRLYITALDAEGPDAR